MTPAPPAAVRAFDDVSGAPRSSEEKIHAWLTKRNANADAHAMVGAIHAARAAYPPSAPAPDFLSVEFCLETGFATWGGGAKRWNPAGIKIAAATGDAPSDFEVPPTPEAGAHLFYNHWAALIGYDPIPPVHGRYAVAKAVYRTKGLYGRVKKVGQLGGGVWATDPRYGSSILALLRDLEGSTPGPAPVEPGILSALRYVQAMVGGRYVAWMSGPFTSTEPAWVGPSTAASLPDAGLVKSRGAFCAAIPTLVLRHLGLPVPHTGADWAGGVLAYGDYYVDAARLAEPFEATGTHEPGDLFIRRYGGAPLSEQGHVALMSTDGVHLIQSDAFDGVGLPGINAKRTLAETDALLRRYDGGGFEYVVKRDKWLGGAA